MEMKLIAVMLTINLSFDLFVWISLWNMVLEQGKLTIGRWTIFAFFCGALFAAIIFVYERQFMTADTHHRLRKVILPITIRVAVIAIAGAVTTQPFEVMFFDGPVQRRIHEESVRTEALSRLRSLEDAALKAQGAIGLKGTIAGQSLDEAKQAHDKAKEQTNTFASQAQTARLEQQRAEGAAKAAAVQAARARTAAQRAAAFRRQGLASQRAEQMRLEAESFEAKTKTSKDNEKELEQKVEGAEEKIGAKEQLAEKDVKRLRDWITQIQNSKAGAAVSENTSESPKWEYEDQDYDFFQRLGVISDLYHGRPARWLNMGPDDRAKLSEAYGLTEIKADDQLAQSRIEADARTFRFSYWAVIGLAAIIPLLLLALKLLYPEDLKRYYSTEAQRRAGNYEALRFYVSQNLTARFESNGVTSGNGTNTALVRGEFHE